MFDNKNAIVGAIMPERVPTCSSDDISLKGFTYR
jgi:hypothetical protein